MNRYFCNNDKQVKELAGFKIPETWWSRPFEYAFCIDFLNENDIVLDVGCGIEHPFKFYAGEKVKEVYAIDVDEKIKELKAKNVKFETVDLINVNKHYSKEKFDKIFIISVLEHTSDFLVEKLTAFKEILKSDGKIILTLDCPALKPSSLIEAVEKAGLKFIGEIDYERPSNAIYSNIYNLYCYSAILGKQEFTFETQEEAPKKTKRR